VIAEMLFHAVLCSFTALESMEVSGGRCNLTVDNAGNIRSIGSGEWRLDLSGSSSQYRLNEESAQARRIGAQVELKSTGLSATLRFQPRPDDVAFSVEPADPSREKLKTVSVTLSFPLRTVLHLAEFAQIGRRLDQDMPVGETYSTGLAHSLLAAEVDGKWVRIWADQRDGRMGAACVVFRHEDRFDATFCWGVDHTDVRIAVHSSLDELLAEHQRWLEQEKGLRKLRDRADVPDWVREVELVITVDMLRSNWEITHDYADLRRLAEEITGIREPKTVLFYIPGWQGAYDSSHPAYRPHPDIGGEDGFRETMAYLKEAGFRVMIHTTSWGIDPYSPNIDDLLPMARSKEDGHPFGWQIDGSWLPGNKPVDMDTSRIPLHGPAKAKEMTFDPPEVSVPFAEVLFSVGGLALPKGARLELLHGRRAIRTPKEGLGAKTEYDFPFPMALRQGKNEVTLRLAGAEAADFRNAWYRVRHAFTTISENDSWTFPILMADTNNPNYVRLFAQNVASVVKEFAIDAVHIDAGSYDGDAAVFDALKERVPNVVISGEYFFTLKAMDFLVLCQSARQSLLRYDACPCEQGALPHDGLGSYYKPWLDKRSPICRFVRDYILFYPHLCAANAFVPVGKVCNTWPARKRPSDTEELWRVLRDWRRLDYLPGLRVNYREYGLDPDSRTAIAEIGRREVDRASPTQSR